MRRICGLRTIGALALGWATALSARAIILYGAGDPAHNTTAPAAELAGSGWQWQGRWSALLGTALAPDFFLTVGHAGGGTGQAFVLDGRSYLAVAAHLAPDADLRLWRVTGTFPSFAPRHTGSTERGAGLVVFGTGTQRGAAVIADGSAGPETKGWLWGPGDNVQRWGTNTVTEVVGATGASAAGRGPQAGDQLRCAFNSGAGGDEAMLSNGDSGGGVFLREAGVWKLAGLSRAVQATFRTTAEGENFSAALFDYGGLYLPTASGWQKVTPLPFDQAAAFFAVRISGSESWIQRVLAGQVPPERQLAVESAAAPEGPFTEEPAARLHAAAAEFTVPLGPAARFYRLRSDAPVPLGRISVRGMEVVLGFGQ